MGSQRVGHDWETELTDWLTPYKFILIEFSRFSLLLCNLFFPFYLISCNSSSDCFFCSVIQLCPTVCNPMDGRMPGLPVSHHLPKFPPVHVHCISDAIQPSHPLMTSSPSACNLFQHWELFQWVSYSHQMTKILELQLQHRSFQGVFRVEYFWYSFIKSTPASWIHI